jgi:hypothetical protein
MNRFKSRIQRDMIKSIKYIYLMNRFKSFNEEMYEKLPTVLQNLKLNYLIFSPMRCKENFFLKVSKLDLLDSSIL